MNIKKLVTSACSLSVSTIVIGTIGIIGAVAVSACNQPDPVGDLIVPFEIGAGIECSLKNVVDIKVTLLEVTSTDAEDVEVESTSVPCAEGKAIFNNVPVGTYSIRIEGYDADDFVVVDNVPKLDNGVVGATEVGEVLEGKETTTEVVTLASTPSKLWVRYELEDGEGFQTMCSQIPLTELAVTAYKNGGADPLLSVVLACDALPTEGNYHYLSDPERELDGSVFDYVRVQPRDATGNIIGADVKYVLPEVPGPGRTVKLTFSASCVDTACDLKCKGDNDCTQD